MKVKARKNNKLLETETITDEERIRESLWRSRHYNLSVVVYGNGKSTCGGNIPIRKIVSDREIPGNEKQSGYRAYEKGSLEKRYQFFQLGDIYTIQISEIFFLDADGKKATGIPIQRNLTIFLNN